MTDKDTLSVIYIYKDQQLTKVFGDRIRWVPTPEHCKQGDTQTHNPSVIYIKIVYCIVVLYI